MVNVLGVLNMVSVVLFKERKKIRLINFVFIMRRCVFQPIGLICLSVLVKSSEVV
ncbi:hypothetical protein RHGRI_034039 [Rhododendron griersonianum]|uniref:Uncharacterized protein n=1 Tax=Rhododendron griersonianum TaxID=479676 RepID=A0AAV6I2W9_9ERIC|nr:hypothetical protein RHGRI_034039 [Rhododendron griersonianum]